MKITEPNKCLLVVKQDDQSEDVVNQKLPLSTVEFLKE